jgi:hypothetical protein
MLMSHIAYDSEEAPHQILATTLTQLPHFDGLNGRKAAEFCGPSP